MTNHQAWAIILILSGLLIVQILPLMQTTSSTHIVGWEYSISSIKDDTWDTEMNQKGSQGWELVFARRATTGGVHSSEAMYECIFKRQSLTMSH